MSQVDVARLLTLLELASSDGEDPRYSEGFSALRGEVEKLSGNDFERIVELGHQMLEEQALDLRVLSYLALGYTFVAGCEGLAAALAGWNWVLKERWEGCFPLREKARSGAAEWLTNPRFAAFLARNESSAESLQRLRQELDQFHSLLAERLGEEQVARLRDVDQWLKKKESALQQQAAPADTEQSDDNADDGPEPAPVAPRPNGNTSAAAAPATRSSIDSDKAEQKTLRELLAWYRQEKRFAQMVSLGRMMRWSDFIVPPADKGKTRLPPLRPASLNAVSAALDRKQWQDALLASEKAFLEPGGQCCLQLQHWSHQAAKAMGLDNVCDCIERETRALLLAHRDLIKLSYSDGEPFMGGSAANWVEGLLQENSGNAASEDDKWSQAGLLAASVSNDKGLVAGLATLDQVPTRGRLERSKQDLLKAELCLVHQRQDLALPLLEAVAERLDDHGIAAWDPHFSLRVWRLLQQALRAQEQGEQLQQRLDEVSRHISRTDITAAAAML